MLFIKQHKLPTILVVMVFLAAGTGIWVFLPQRIATPIIPKHPTYQFPPPVLSYPTLPKTLNQEMAKITPPWQKMTSKEKRLINNLYFAVATDTTTGIPSKTYYSTPVCTPKDLKVTLTSLDVPDTRYGQSASLEVYIKISHLILAIRCISYRLVAGSVVRGYGRLNVPRASLALLRGAIITFYTYLTHHMLALLRRLYRLLRQLHYAV